MSAGEGPSRVGALLSGFAIRSNAYVSDGTIVWTSGTDVVGIATAQRAKFLALFGFREHAPKNADGAILSPGDYADLLAQTASSQTD